jgi:GNAT superfamily N-acetyltransferase
MSASYPKIRTAVAADMPQLLEMGLDLHKEIGMLNPAPDLIEETFKQAIAGDGAVLGVIGPIGAVEGMIYLVIGRHWYSRDPHVEEMFNYVRPEFRRSKNAKALIEYAKATAIKLNVPLLIGILSTTDTKRKVAMYERLLGEPAGAYFLFNGKTGTQ